ncbi:MAG: alpha-1,2-fucosyltransferase, partial [Coriobacteriia bacterium]|nr:alpha-1,2-fucosyltransferase [Coriobacteriia bacterium]
TENPRYQQLAARITAAGTASTSLHVRRGDYVSGAAPLGTCNQDYYQRAIKTVAQSTGQTPSVFIFSDDPQWVRENLHFEQCSYSVIDSANYDSSVEDLALMGLCHHHIIANSSYSWWGAWTGERSGSVIIAPQQWFPKTCGNLTPVPARWQRLCSNVVGV